MAIACGRTVVEAHNSAVRNEASVALRELAGAGTRGDRTKAAIQRAARIVGLNYSRAFEIWYGRARRIEQYEREKISEALDRKRREHARNEFHELQTRLARLEARLSRTDEDFHRETIDSVREQARGLGGMGGPVGRKT